MISVERTNFIANTVYDQLSRELKSRNEFIFDSFTSTDGILSLLFDQVDPLSVEQEQILDSVITSHVPDYTNLIPKFSDLSISYKYFTQLNRIDINSLNYVNVFSQDFNIRYPGTYRIHISYKYGYSSMVRKISVKTTLFNENDNYAELVDLFHSSGLNPDANNLLMLPNGMVKFVPITNTDITVEKIYKVKIDVACDNILDNAAISNINFEIYRI
jgi:hypothetical protein